jgi:membrane-bound ClpP family serine protease
MGIGVSIFLIAVGAILKFAVNAHATGFSIATVGVILMIVGAIGLIMSTLIFGSWRNRSAVVERNNTVVDRTTYPTSTPVVEERVYRDQL